MSAERVSPHIVHKGWGYERWIANRSYCGKELFLFAGKKCSLHYHEKKDETFWIVGGEALVRHAHFETGLAAAQYADRFTEDKLGVGHMLHIPVMTVHQILAITDVRIVEVSTHHEDSDSIRLQPGD